MKKRTLVIALCCTLVLLCICNGGIIKFKRIDFGEPCPDEDPMKKIDGNTAVINDVDSPFPSKLPLYRAVKHRISQNAFRQMEEQLGITSWYFNKFDGYRISGRLAEYAPSTRRFFDTLNMTDEELETLAWETFHKIPFLKGEYIYTGITGESTMESSKEGERTTEVTVTFRRILDGLPVLGDDKCSLSFDGSGLVGISVSLFDYIKIGTMDVIPPEEAEANIKTPDYFDMSINHGIAQTLRVDQIKLAWANQYSNHCTILQPFYTFKGTASFPDGAQTKFTSRVIAIPKSYTYEIK